MPERVKTADRGCDRPRCLAGCADLGEDWALASTSVLEAIVARLPAAHRAMPRRRRSRRCSSIAGTMPISVSLSWCGSSMAAMQARVRSIRFIAYGCAPAISSAWARFRPKMAVLIDRSSNPGEVGYITAAGEGQVTDTKRRRHADRRPAPPGDTHRWPASSPAQPVVFCSLFPVDAADFEHLRG